MSAFLQLMAANRRLRGPSGIATRNDAFNTLTERVEQVAIAWKAPAADASTGASGGRNGGLTSADAGREGATR
jgi:hypothetical protein